MANDFTDIIPKVLAQAMIVLRYNTTMPRLVATDYGAEAAQKGSVIDVPIPPTIAVRDVTPSENQPSTPDIEIGTAQIPLSRWREAPFEMTDKEIMEIKNDMIPMSVRAAAASLAEDINSYILEQYIDVYSFGGTPGTTPFTGSPATTTDATQASKRLTNQKAPRSLRRMVLDPDATANALELGAFQDASKSADPAVITEGSVGRKLGFDWYEDQQVPTHTAGTITTGLTVTGAEAIGSKSIQCTTAATTGACALLKGDIVTFAGDDQTYVLTADATQASPASSVDLLIEPGLVVATSGSEAVTVKGDHVVNLAFQRNAFAFASRPLQDVSRQIGMDTMMESITDPLTGLSMRLEVTRQHKQTLWSLDMLFGAACIRPELATRLAG